MSTRESPLIQFEVTTDVSLIQDAAGTLSGRKAWQTTVWTPHVTTGATWIYDTSRSIAWEAGTKSPGPNGFTAKFCQTFQQLTPIFHKPFKTVERKAIIPNASMKPTLP